MKILIQHPNKWNSLIAAGVIFSALGVAHAGQPDSPDVRRSGALGIFQQVLIREGMMIVDEEGQLTHNEERKLWTVVVKQDKRDDVHHELFVLPCKQLEKMELIKESTGENEVTFRVTGRITVFRERNYVLPTHMAVVHVKSPIPAETDEEPETVSDDDSSSNDADEIISELVEETGSLARSADDDAWSLSKSVSNETDVTGDHWKEGMTIVNRRGRIRRDESGGWLFVFDADSSGLSDPPVRLLPCLLLERIENYTRSREFRGAALLNGTIYSYRGQSYLLPTLFRIPSDRDNLQP